QSIYAAGSEGKVSTGPYLRTITVRVTDNGGFTNDAVNSWRGEGNATDSGSAGQNGTLVNTTFAAGKVGQAFSFNGSNSYVKLPDTFFPYPTVNSSATPFTFDAWFKTSAGGVILGQQNADPFNGPSGFVPAVYVGTDGLLRAEIFWNGTV